MLTESFRNIFLKFPWFVTGVDHPVKLHCPEHDHVIATEATVPEWTDDKLAAYDCDRCYQEHVFRWGPPTPEYVGDEVRNTW